MLPVSTLPGQVSADDMAGLVREHADDLVGRGRLRNRARIHKNAMCVHHERVERFIVDDDDLNVLLAQARNAQNERRIIAQELLDLGIADHRDAGRRPGLCAYRDAAQGAAQADRRGCGNRDRA
jgi:hypothetical protein